MRQARQSTRWSIFSVRSSPPESSTWNFCAGQRRSRPSSDAVLLCDNLAIRWIGVQDASAHRRVLAWPHWMLKTTYTPLGYMIGKFGLHAQGVDRGGRWVAPVPLSFLSLRVAVQRKDPQFLRETPHIAEQLTAAHDQGQHPFAYVPDLVDIPMTRRALRTPERYLRVNAWARAQIPPTGNS